MSYFKKTNQYITVFMKRDISDASISFKLRSRCKIRRLVRALLIILDLDIICEQVHLYYNGNFLSQNHTLKEYNLKDGEVIVYEVHI